MKWKMSGVRKEDFGLPCIQAKEIASIIWASTEIGNNIVLARHITMELVQTFFIDANTYADSWFGYNFKRIKI